MKRRRQVKSRSTPTRKKARPSKPKRRVVSLHKASQGVRASVLRGIHQVLRDHGIAGRVAEMHLEPAGAPAEIDAPDTDMCPPGTIRRVVCARQDDGTLSCEEKCVPVSSRV